MASQRLMAYGLHLGARLPVHATYRGYDLYGMPLPSSGGVTAFEALNILEGYDLESLPRTQVEHLYLEASRLAFADRDAYLADPEYVDAPVAGLLSKDCCSCTHSIRNRCARRHRPCWASRCRC